MKNGVKFTSSLLKYSIHGQNYEMIEKNRGNTFYSYIECLIESIKCHCCDLTQFIFNSYLKDLIENIEVFDEKFNKNCLNNYNYVSLFEPNKNSMYYLIEIINKKQLECNDAKTIKQEESFDEKLYKIKFMINLK